MNSLAQPDRPKRASAATSVWRGFSTMFRVMRWVILAFAAAFVLAVLLHTFCHCCPFSFSIVQRNDERPVLYGYPCGLPPAWRGKVVLGGCVVMPISTVCPHCGWPMRYCDPCAMDNMPEIDVVELFGVSLNEQAKASLRDLVATVGSTPLGDVDEGIIAAAKSKTDLWLSARCQGLYRMDLQTGMWNTNRVDQPWNCMVKSITILEDTVKVDYCPFGTATYFQTAVTADGGRTWRLVSGALPLLQEESP